MARYNEILVGHFNRYLQKLLQMKGEPPAPQLAGEITPIIPMFAGVENRYLAAWDRFAGVGIIAAVAAQNGALRIRNPAGSNVVGVVEAISIGVNADSTVGLFWSNSNNADLGGATAVKAIDGRSRPTSTMIASAGNNVTQFTIQLQAWTVKLAQNDFQAIIFEEQELQLTPGVTFDILNQTVNVGFHVNVFFRERFLEESERT